MPIYLSGRFDVEPRRHFLTTRHAERWMSRNIGRDWGERGYSAISRECPQPAPRRRRPAGDLFAGQARPGDECLDARGRRVRVVGPASGGRVRLLSVRRRSSRAVGWFYPLRRRRGFWPVLTLLDL